MAFFDDMPLQVGGAAAKAVGALDAKAIESVKTETGKLINAAKSGGFRLSEEGMKPIRDALAKLSLDLDRITQTTMLPLSQAPRLGSHPYGQKVASHDQKSASEEIGSASVVLRQFGAILKDAHEAVERAAGVYRENEDNQRAAWNGR